MTAGTEQADVSRVIAAMQLGRLQEGLGLLAPLLASDPGNAWLWVLQSSALLGLERYDEAHRAAQKALSLDPESAAAHYYLGLSLWNSQVLGKRMIRPAVRAHAKKALEHVREAVRLEPYDTDYQVALAQLQQMSGEKAAAEHTLQQALELDSEHIDAQLALGRLALENNDPVQAELHARRVLEQEPESSEAMGLLAWAQMKLNNPITALSTAHDAVRADPANPATHKFFEALCHVYLPRPLGAASWVWRFALVPHLSAVILPFGAVGIQVTNFRKLAALPPELRQAVGRVRPMTRERWAFGAIGLSLLLLVAGLLVPNKVISSALGLAAGLVLQGLLVFWLGWQLWKLGRRLLSR